MNQKKCPKCGENNPPEAVMCWACYTPLSGGAVAPATAGPGGRGAGGAATMTADAAGGGGVAIPSWVYGVGGAVLVIALLVGAKVLLFSPPEEATTPVDAVQQNYPTGSTGSNYPKSSGSPSPPISSSSGVTTQLQNPVTNPDQGFTFVVTPNGTYTTGVMGIIPKQQMGVQQAASLARFAASLYISRHSQIQVYVFNDPQTADRFKNAQAGRKNAPLTEDEFTSMSDVWVNTPACVVVTKSSTKTYSPSGDGNFWKNLI